MKDNMIQYVIFAGTYPEAADHIREMGYKLGEYRIISKYTMIMNLSPKVKYQIRLVGSWEKNPAVKLAHKVFVDKYGN